MPKQAAQLDEGHTLAAATRITELQDELSHARDEIARLRGRSEGPAA